MLCGGYKGDYQGLHHDQTLNDNDYSEKYTSQISRDDCYAFILSSNDSFRQISKTSEFHFNQSI